MYIDYAYIGYSSRFSRSAFTGFIS